MPPEGGDGPRAAGAHTRVFALLGDPVAHSLSPLIHNAALEAEGLDGVYIAQRTAADDVPAAMRSLARDGGGGNVTVPHKRIAAEALDTATDAVRATGACNTFWLENGRLAGDNTDVVGFKRALRGLIGDAVGARVLLLGAGGGAAAALLALLEARVDEVVVANRTPDHAEVMIARVAPGDQRVRLGAADVGFNDQFDLIVNATSLGLHPDDPLPPLVHTVRAALDMVYGPEGTRWTRALGKAGIRAIDGKEMLLHQAAAAFERWWHRPAPLDAMRAVLDADGAAAERRDASGDRRGMTGDRRGARGEG